MSKYRRHRYHHYPLPSTSQLEWFQDLTLTQSSSVSHPQSDNPLSHTPSTTDISLIAKYARYIPWIQEIYLSGEITWDTSSQTIGLCIVTTPQRIRTVYTTMTLILKCVAIVSSHHFHLQAVIDHDDMSVYSLAYKPVDPYLVYRIAHLTLIYMDYNIQSADIYSHNHRISHILPLYTFEQTVNNDIPVVLWSHRTKIILQTIWQKRIWYMIEKILHMIIHTYIIWKYRKHVHDMPLVTDHIIASWSSQRFDDHLLYKHHKWGI